MGKKNEKKTRKNYCKAIGYTAGKYTLLEHYSHFWVYNWLEMKFKIISLKRWNVPSVLKVYICVQ